MSSLKKLGAHSSHYFLGELLVLIASLVSFPIFTRLFSQEEYGVMSLLTITLSLGSILAGLGLRSSVVRYYSIMKAGGDNPGITSLYSTTFLTTLVSGLIFSGAIALSSYLPVSFVPKEQAIFLRVGAVLILIRSLFRLILNMLRAEQKTLTYNIFYVLQQYLTLGLSLFLVVKAGQGLMGLVSAQVLTEAVILILLAVFLWRERKLSFSAFDKLLAKETLIYGLPLIVLNFSQLVMSFGDRYVINGFLGLTSVAIYSVGFNVGNYLGTLIQTPLNTAIGPIYMELWEEQGKEATERFLSQVARYYLMFGVALIAGLTALNKEIIILVASVKYESSHSVVPLIITGIILAGLNSITASGLFLKKRTGLYGTLILAGAILNIVLNLVLVPFFGIQGSAFATLLAYIVLHFLIAHFAYPIARVTFQPVAVLKYIAAAVMMALVVHHTRLSGLPEAVSLGLRIAEGALCFTVFILILDSDLRRMAGKFLKGANPLKTLKGVAE